MFNVITNKLTQVLEIQDLQCAYSEGKTVLHIQNLVIPYNKLVFIIGRSGIGKSTFIETLGLMNKTIVSSEHAKIKFYPDINNTEEWVDLCNSWALPNNEISDLRRKYFSFIFQRTNLMPNFSAGENMMVSRLIEGEKIKEVKEEVLNVMDQLSLERSLFDKKITELSGGQRQRLAFVRAITADFTILFGDEPTGNLDRNTAEELLDVLKTQIRKKNKTGIIVSHDLSLALKFADVIVPITTKMTGEGEGSGIVENKNILQQLDGKWYDNEAQIIAQPIHHLSGFLSA